MVKEKKLTKRQKDILDYIKKFCANKKYYVSINVDNKVLPFLKIGDTINIKIYKENDVTEIIDIN